MQLEFDLTTSGKGFGVQTDEQLRVTAVAEGGAADGKLMVGDIILAVNDVSISSQSLLENTLLSAGSSLKVRVSRADTDSSNSGRAESDENNTISDTEVILKYTMGSKKKLGLGVNHEGGEIRVSKVLVGSVADEVLHEGDIIKEIDGVKPTSKENTRNLLVNALKKNGQAVLKIVTVHVEKKGDEPSVMMTSDVLEIAQRQKERLLSEKPEEKPAVRGILGRYTEPSEQREQKRLDVETEHRSLMIGMDPVDHPLMHVKPDSNQCDDSHSE